MTQSEMFEITLTEVVAELRRELAMRERVYPRRIEAGQLNQRAADRQMALLEEAIKRLDPYNLKLDTEADLRHGGERYVKLHEFSRLMRAYREMAEQLRVERGETL